MAIHAPAVHQAHAAPRPVEQNGALQSGALQSGASLLQRKAEMEAAMLAAPDDRALRNGYFDHLNSVSVAHTGLQTAMLPEIGMPLYFRCGTPDVAVLAQVFRDHTTAFEMRPTPLRILVVGAYAGYSSIELARRYPRAQIVAAEPLPDNFRILALNTGAWRRIRPANVALWHHATRLSATLRFQADWAIRLHDEAEQADRTLPALSMRDLFARIGWQGADLIVCDASGSEREIFADPLAPWLGTLDAAFVRLHEQVSPRAGEWVNAALPAETFEHRRVGETELFVRKVPRQALPPIPAEVPLLRTEPGLTGFTLSDVPQANFGFFVYDGNNCQLHPQPPGAKVSRVVFTVRAAGHRRFTAGVTHAGRPSFPIVFTAAVQREDGSIAGHAEATMKQRESGRVQFDFAEPVVGTVRVVLQTRMLAGAANANMAWARWLDPKLV